MTLLLEQLPLVSPSDLGTCMAVADDLAGELSVNIGCCLRRDLSGPLQHSHGLRKRVIRVQERMHQIVLLCVEPIHTLSTIHKSVHLLCLQPT